MGKVVSTARFACREMAVADTDFLAVMLGDPEVMRYYPKPLDRSEAEAWLQRVLGSYARAGHGFWLVERKEDGEKVGQIGDIIHAGMPHLLFEYRRP